MRVSAPAIWLMGLPNLFSALRFSGPAISSDDERRGKSPIETRCGGTTFIDAAAPTRCFVRDRAMPDSRVPTFRAGQPRGPHPLLHAQRRTPPNTAEHRPAGRPVRGQGAADNAEQALYLDGAKRRTRRPGQSSEYRRRNTGVPAQRRRLSAAPAWGTKHPFPNAVAEGGRDR